MNYIPVFDRPLTLNYFNTVPREKEILIESFAFDEYPNVLVLIIMVRFFLKLMKFRLVMMLFYRFKWIPQ